MAGSTLAFEQATVRSRTSGPAFLQRVTGSPSGAFGGILLATLLLAGFVGPWFPTHDPGAQNLLMTVVPPSLSSRSGELHLLGTDQLGRDVLSRLLLGLRISLLVAFAVVPVSATVGVLVGMASGYFGKRTDVIAMRVVDAQLAVPALLLLIAVVAVVGTGLLQIILVLAIAGWPTYARVLRGEVMALREREFVVAARATGASDTRILRSHILPNLLPTVIVLATLQLPTVIVWEAALSFLGLGIQPPTPSLGQMLGHSQELIWRAWWMPTIPGTVITLVALAFNLLGDRVRDVLDPRLRGIGHG